ncbi:helix-turn-helix transcriptional regulator [Paenibacillus alkalitolerans]|uniref:helix-turn-helix transcriptional regulator n=1 Tax=Paenibacillus alkalitolerans TaxID=2799335 RepID=UPI0018F79B5D|nr:AraC family transcriptional regulator [Paenibacillus alkalitolerans]
MNIRNYFLPPFEELDFFCFPHSVGRFTRPNYIPPNNHDVHRETGVRDFSLHFVVGGKGYVEMHDTVYTVKQGDAFLHLPNQRMRYYTSEDDSWDIYWIQFNGRKLADFLLERGFHESSVWFMKEIGMLEQSFLDLMDEIERNNISRPGKISTLTYSVLIEFMGNAIPFSSRKGREKIDRIIQLLPDMQQNSHLPFVMEEWANKAELTPNYFNSLFKKVTKMTPLAYITKCRIQTSKQMLLGSPSLPINKVAMASGYPSASYFNKVFMELEGITPSEFRKNHLYEKITVPTDV